MAGREIVLRLCERQQATNQPELDEVLGFESIQWGKEIALGQELLSERLAKRRIVHEGRPDRDVERIVMTWRREGLAVEGIAGVPTQILAFG